MVGLERGSLSLVSTIESKNSGSGLEIWEYGRREAPRVYPQKLALSSSTSGGRSVGKVRSRTQATEFRFLVLYTGSTDSLCRVTYFNSSWDLFASQRAVKNRKQTLTNKKKMRFKSRNILSIRCHTAVYLSAAIYNCILNNIDTFISRSVANNTRSSMAQVTVHLPMDWLNLLLYFFKHLLTLFVSHSDFLAPLSTSSCKLLFMSSFTHIRSLESAIKSLIPSIYPYPWNNLGTAGLILSRTFTKTKLN
jgi:hypothetical protein